MGIIICLKKRNRDQKNPKKSIARQKLFKSYSKEKTVGYYAKNKEAIKEKIIDHYKNLSQEEKTRLMSTQKKGIKNWFNIKKKR